MIRYLLIGLLLSGCFLLEFLAASLPVVGFAVPDMALALVFVYAAKGRGSILVPLCFLVSWIKGAGSVEPVGFYLLTYLLLGFLVHKLRKFFFIERPLTQFMLCFFFVFCFWLIQAACRSLGLLTRPHPEIVDHQLYAYISTICLIPFVFVVYYRLTSLRRWLHP